MSSFNNMDNVPVKIGENYKPPPRVYQLPVAIANKLHLLPDHYHTAPQYSYDFQLERSVLLKIPEWRKVRQLEREARRERKDRREQQFLREVERHNKQLLGAVCYPSAEDLYLPDEGDEDDKKQRDMENETKKESDKPLFVRDKCNFHDILQPTILSRKDENNIGADKTALSSSSEKGGGNSLNADKTSSVFNYKDFEDDTSSPFDTVELKSIDDLDILAQVLRRSKEQQREKEDNEGKDENEKHTLNEGVLTSKCDQEEKSSLIKTGRAEASANPVPNDLVQGVANLTTIENTKAALEKVDFNELSEQLQNEYIPNGNRTQVAFRERDANITDFHFFQTNVPPLTAVFPNQAAAYMPYNQLYNGMEQQQQYSNYNIQSRVYNQNHHIYSNNCNSGAGFMNFTPVPQSNGQTDGSYLSPNLITNAAYTSPQVPLEVERNLKSKSVPDILKELSDEIRKSEVRRSRNYSYNSDDASPDSKEKRISEQSPVKTVFKNHESEHYVKLGASAQKLAKSISSMGFPLERVAKIAQIFGADDKKIIEHLIPLSELMDLGFEESKISEALMKFDNNKEKALEYLIS